MPKKALSLAGLNAPAHTLAEVETIEAAMEGVFGESRFKAYLQRHEVETLLLADIDALITTFPRNKASIEQLRIDIAGFTNVEDINHGDETHPAARLEAAINGYRHLKASRAFWVLANADLSVVRARSHRFNCWLRYWEQWGEGNALTSS